MPITPPLPYRTVHVLTRRHTDGSAPTEILRAYDDIGHAKYDLSLTAGDYGMTYEIHTIHRIEGNVQ